ncbi:ATG1 [Candida margitis]|uniref:ATG1 n=1 Tax=Candida margitis TaxID=1775924 RepID=UPI00222735C2|nr:ATG1 [Candida margitis]KAI5969915.1 ATG1 [Candida margitis]
MSDSHKQPPYHNNQHYQQQPPSSASSNTTTINRITQHHLSNAVPPPAKTTTTMRTTMPQHPAPPPLHNDRTTGIHAAEAASSTTTTATTTTTNTSILSASLSSNASTRKTEYIGVYAVGREIGKGSFAIVYKGHDTTTNKPVAIKSVYRSKLKSKKLVENLEIEIQILKTMKHPHIVGLLDYKQTAAHFHLIMDYCSMGDLSYFIRRRSQLVKTHPVISSLLERYPSPPNSHGLNQVLILHFLRQLSSALIFLREKSLVHRDIKPQNLLLCPPLHSKQEFIKGEYSGMWELPILKIADFGFARFLPSTSMAETLCGSPLYMAPEILRYEKYNAKADLWSVGAVLYEMTVGKPPFKAGNHIELLKNIEKANDKIKFPSAAEVPDSLKQLIRSLLKYNPTERISFQEFFNDDLITCDLEDTDKPLETSDMDENLFISEYISPIKPSERSQLIKNDTITPMTPAFDPITKAIQDQDRDQVSVDEVDAISLPRQGVKADPAPIDKYKERDNDSANTTRDGPYAEGRSRVSSSRDDDIKRLIDKNSPDPEHLSHSIVNNDSTHFKSRKEDMVLEKDYVVVEKRVVEVNAVADELARAGSGADAMSDPRNHLEGDKSKHPQRPSQRSRKNSLGGYQRRPSFTDRRISISISPTNALSKAIGLASHRLFGGNNVSSVPSQIPTTTAISEEGGDVQNRKSKTDLASFSNVMSSPNFVNNTLLQKLNLPVSSTLVTLSDDDDNDDAKNVTPDELVLNRLETIATKSHAVNLFADVKFSQLIPSPPSLDDAGHEFLDHNDALPPKIVRTICEEGVVLYVKALSLLAKGMSVASEWWYDSFNNAVGDEYGNGNNARRDIQTSIKINQLVQWIREKFNECLEKAEFIKLRLQEANTAIAKADGLEFIPEARSSSQKVIAERLIFDRALEMSRNAAVNELVKEDLKGCELAYSTAIWMLEALLDEDDTKEHENERKLDNEDRVMVEKFIVSIGNRLSVLKKKMELI